MDYAFTVPLETLRAGEWAEITDVDGEPSWVGRMAELGLQVGAKCQMIRGGCPCLVRVGDTQLSIRNPGCYQILVQPISVSSIP
ncbi:MAG: ferrous iron transport protein A [Gemmataceae bacterium]